MKRHKNSPNDDYVDFMQERLDYAVYKKEVFERFRSIVIEVVFNAENKYNKIILSNNHYKVSQQYCEE